MADVTVVTSSDALLHWLCEPELMLTWMLNVDQVALLSDQAVALDARTAVRVRISGRSLRPKFTFPGRIVEIGPYRLVRQYVVPDYAGRPGDMRRTITYDITPDGPNCRLRCTVVNEFPDLAAMAARAAGRAEQKSLIRALQILQQRIAGGKPSLLRRKLRDEYLAPMAL
jgi:hypothetical protein